MYTFRNPIALYSLLGIALFDAALISSVFYNVGHKTAVLPIETEEEALNYAEV